MSLSSLIVQREVATIREVEEALARQVLYGGDLVTNLLEVGRVDEGALMALVAETYGLPPAPPGELPLATDDAKKVVVAEIANEKGMVPLSVDRYGLVVAVAEPLSKEAEQELTFALALPIAQKIAPAVRIRQALARDYGVSLERRFQRLLSRLLGERTGLSSLPPPYITAPELRAVRPPSAPARPAEKPVSKPPRPEGMPKTLVRDGEVEPPRPPRRRRGPLTADIARAELEEAGARDAIFDIVFDFARQYFDYTALFGVHGDVAEGRDAFGDGASRDKIVKIGVPLDLPGMLSMARTTKALVRGVPQNAGVDPTLMEDLGRKGDTECFVVPIVVRTRVVAMVFGDAGPGGIDEVSLADVLAIGRAAAGAFERIIVRRKLKGTQPPGAAESVPPQKPSNAPPTQVSAQPAVEELAPPIRELLAEPVSRIATETSREPVAQGVFVPTGSEDQPLAGRPLSEQPPPANILGVRRPSGPPIPREEPESFGEINVSMPRTPKQPPREAAPPSSRGPASKRASGQHRRAEAPKLDFAAKPQPSSIFGGGALDVDGVERRLLAEIEGRGEKIESGPLTTRDEAPPAFTIEPGPPSPKAESPIPPRPAAKTDLSPIALDFGHQAKPIAVVEAEEHAPTPVAPPLLEVVDVDDRDVQSLPPSRPPAQPFLETDSAREQAAAVAVPSSGGPPTPDRRYPSSHDKISVGAHRPPTSRTDVSVLPSVIVDVSSEYVSLVDRVIAGSDEDAESELIRGGGHAMPAIMAKFPGPVTVEKERLAYGPLPRVGECGPVLKLVASQRRTALPFVLALIEDADPERRFWATYLLTELVYVEAAEPAALRVFDDDPRVRRVARSAIRAIAEHHPRAVVDRLEAIAKDAGQPSARRVLAIEALGEAREPQAVPALIARLDDPTVAVATAAKTALVLTTRQDFGIDFAKWRAWWSANEERHRIEWLIDSLMHDSAAVRAAASEELKTLTKEYFGYYEDLPKRERERAQSRYREWWSSIGRVRFSRASASRA